MPIRVKMRMGYIKTQRFDRKFSFCPRHPRFGRPPQIIHPCSHPHRRWGVPCARGWSPGAGRAGAAPCPAWILCRWASQTACARMVVGAAHLQPCPATRLLNQCWWRAGLEGCRVRADGRRALAARAPRPARYGSCAAGPARPRARAWWAVPRPRNQSGARTPAAARSRVAAAACVTAAAVAHARTVSNPGLFVPTVNRGVEL